MGRCLHEEAACVCVALLTMRSAFAQCPTTPLPGVPWSDNDFVVLHQQQLNQANCCCINNALTGWIDAGPIDSGLGCPCEITVPCVIDCEFETYASRRNITATADPGRKFHLGQDGSYKVSNVYTKSIHYLCDCERLSEPWSTDCFDLLTDPVTILKYGCDDC